MRTRLLALDADGTLIHPDGGLRPAVRSAVRAAQNRGLSVIICTGRRFRTTKPLLEELGLSGPVVLHNGVVVKDSRSAETLSDHYLSEDLYRGAMEIMRGVATPLVYVDHYHEGVDLYTEPTSHCHEFQTEYVADNLEVVREVEDLDPPPSESVIMLSAMADRDVLAGLEDRIAASVGDAVETNFIANKNYRGHILEVVRGGASKWSALIRLAAGLGIEPEEIAAIGDDNNDLEMIQKSGIGIAMENAVPAVLDAADHVTGSNAEDGAAQAIDEILAGRIAPGEA